MCPKVVLPPIPGSQHRPILLRVTSVAKTRDTPFQRKYNFRKKKWDSFSKDLESYLTFDSVFENCKKFMKCVRGHRTEKVPRGCRTKHIPGLNDSAKDLLNAYNPEYNLDPFFEKTVELGHEQLQSIGSFRKQQWMKMMESIDMKIRSKRA